MEKKKTDLGLAFKPKIPAKGFLKDFSRVTERNRKNAIVLGRILYIIRSTYGKKESSASIFGDEESLDFNKPLKNELAAFFVVSPRMIKGWWSIPNFPWALSHPHIEGKTHWKCFVDEDTEYNHWRETWDQTISREIKAESLYIKPSDPILQFYHNLK